MSKPYIIAVRSSRLFVKGAAIRDHDKKKMPYFTTEPAQAISFEDEFYAKDYIDKLVSGTRRFMVEQFG